MSVVYVAFERERRRPSDVAYVTVRRALILGGDADVVHDQIAGRELDSTCARKGHVSHGSSRCSYVECLPLISNCTCVYRAPR